MSPLPLALWGLAGGFAVEGLELVAAIRRTRGWPWRAHGEVGLGPYLISVVLRVTISGLLAVALGANGQVSGPAGAMMIGITAPLLVEKAFRQIASTNIPLNGGSASTPNAPDSQSGASTPTATPPAVRWETGDVV